MQCRHFDGDLTNNRQRNLLWGTTQDNIDDQIRHGTKVRGERTGGSKLTEAKVREIRQRYAAGGCTQKQLGYEFGVTQAAIWFVLNRTWTHVF